MYKSSFVTRINFCSYLGDCPHFLEFFKVIIQRKLIESIKPIFHRCYVFKILWEGPHLAWRLDLVFIFDFLLKFISCWILVLILFIQDLFLIISCLFEWVFSYVSQWKFKWMLVKSWNLAWTSASFAIKSWSTTDPWLFN